MNRATITAAVVQMDCRIREKEYNLKRVHALLDDVKPGTDVVCFPEFFTTGYHLSIIGEAFYDLAETIPGPTTELLARHARRNHRTIFGNIVERDPHDKRKLYDTAFVVDGEGRLAGAYRKYFLFPPERRYFTAGTDVPVVPVGAATYGMAICFDHAFPELFRLLALKGAHIVVIPSAVPKGYEYLLDLRSRARAQDNQYFVLAANRVGREDSVAYCGRSKIVDPRGTVLAEARSDGEETIYATLDLSVLERERAQEPVVETLRPELYRTLERRAGPGQSGTVTPDPA